MNSPRHIRNGLLFVAVCVGLGVLLFVLLQVSSTTPDAESDSDSTGFEASNDEPAGQIVGEQRVEAQAVDSTLDTEYQTDTLEAEIIRGAEPKVSIAGRFSISYRGCGTGCVSYWLVDRKAGKVFDVPDAPEPDFVVDGIVSPSPDSETFTVVYDIVGYQGTCKLQEFRWTGSGFQAISDFTPSPCSG